MTDDAPTPTLSPMIGVPDAEQAIAFYAEVFGARKVGPYLATPDGAVVHAEIAIGDALVMLAEHRAGAAADPLALGDATVRLSLTVEDVDAVFARASAAGATVLIPPADQFYGHRDGRLRDPFGHIWVVGQTLEQVSPEEMGRRMAEMMKG